MCEKYRRNGTIGGISHALNLSWYFLWNNSNFSLLRTLKKTCGNIFKVAKKVKLVTTVFEVFWETFNMVGWPEHQQKCIKVTSLG